MRGIDKIVTGLLAVGLSVALAGSAGATLFDRGSGLIYDDDLNITWLQDAGLGGAQTWDNAMAWAENLVFAGFDGWRLPNALNADKTGPCGGFNCTGSEMGHLYYTELGNVAGGPLANTGLFTNLQAGFYWSGTEFSSDRAWGFNFDVGGQNAGSKGINFFAWAVRPGDVSAVPEPATGLLWGVGLGGLLWYRRRMGRIHG